MVYDAKALHSQALPAKAQLISQAFCQASSRWKPLRLPHNPRTGFGCGPWPYIAGWWLTASRLPWRQTQPKRVQSVLLNSACRRDASNSSRQKASQGAFQSLRHRTKMRQQTNGVPPCMASGTRSLQGPSRNVEPARQAVKKRRVGAVGAVGARIEVIEEFGKFGYLATSLPLAPLSRRLARVSTAGAWGRCQFLAGAGAFSLKMWPSGHSPKMPKVPQAVQRESPHLYTRPWWKFVPSQGILNLSSSLTKDTWGLGRPFTHRLVTHFARLGCPAPFQVHKHASGRGAPSAFSMKGVSPARMQRKLGEHHEL